MNCKRCNSERIASLSAKCNDLFTATIGEEVYDGYVPGDMGIGEGDYIEFDYCLDCGQLQGAFPLMLTEIELKEE